MMRSHPRSAPRRTITSISLLVVGALAAVACTVKDSPDTAEDPAGACADLHVERFKELMIVDEGVLTDPRAMNATGGTWSFRHAIENMMPEGADPSEFVLTWLRSGWNESKSLNGYSLEPTIGPLNETRDLDGRIICPWIKRTCEAREGGPSPSCNQCTGPIALEYAPFRLTAIVNRMDQRVEVDSEPMGEGRLVFGLTDGSADDPSVRALPMSVIFEYRLPETRSVREWANAWHALGQFPDFGEPYRAALEGVTNGFTKRGANPNAVNGSAIGQIRTNESALNWQWQLREFGLDAIGELRIRPLRNTPHVSLNNTETLKAFVTANADAIRKNRFELPDNLRSGSADLFRYQWKIPDVDEATRRAFALNTCNGCHAENPTLDSAFHVSVFKKGTDKLSPFVNDPKGGPDDLTHRTKLHQQALCME